MRHPLAGGLQSPPAVLWLVPLLSLAIVPAAVAPPVKGSKKTEGASTPLFDRSHPDAAPTPHSNRLFAAERHTSIATCSAHDAPESCEATGCYWSNASRKCYVRYVPGSEGTYAQNFQDWWVRKLAEANGWGKEGTFLDLGAHSGLWCSNTKLLEEKLGWRGVCVEPFPVRFCHCPRPGQHAACLCRAQCCA